MKEIIKTYSDNGLTLSYREVDNYVNATEMCKLAGKSWADYSRLKETEAFLDELSQNMGIPIFKLIESRRGKNGGTYVHELVAYNLAPWCSPKVAVFVAKLLQAIKNGELILLQKQANWKNQRFEAKDSNKLLNQALNEVLGDEIKRYHFMNDARMIFKIVKGVYPSEFCNQNNLKEARDGLNIEDLFWIDRLQRLDCSLILFGDSYEVRKEKLIEYFLKHKDTLKITPISLKDTTNYLPAIT